MHQLTQPAYPELQEMSQPELQTAAWTYSVFAICLLLTLNGGVGTVAIPVRAGSCSGAFSAKTALSVLKKSGSLLMASAIFFNVSRLAGALSTSSSICFSVSSRAAFTAFYRVR